VWDEPLLVDTSSLGIYTGHAKASLPDEELHQEHYMSIKGIKSFDYFKINIESTEEIVSRESKLEVNVSFVTEEESLPVDGTCEVKVKSFYLESHIKDLILFRRNFTTSSDIETTRLEFDITKELDIIGFDYSDVFLIFETIVECSHSSSGIQVRAFHVLSLCPSAMI